MDPGRDRREPTPGMKSVGFSDANLQVEIVVTNWKKILRFLFERMRTDDVLRTGVDYIFFPFQ